MREVEFRIATHNSLSRNGRPLTIRKKTFRSNQASRLSAL
jgi:hypothetical protein